VDAEPNVVLLTALLERVVDAAEVSQPGALVLTFEGGFVLTVGPDGDYESWTVAGPAGVKLIRQPGGEIAVRSAAPENVVGYRSILMVILLSANRPLRPRGPRRPIASSGDI
jgi:hypothetical protein